MYKQDQKEIYKYYNGVKICFVDPLEVRLALEGVDANWQDTFKLMQEEDAGAIKDCISIARKMFNLPEPYYDEASDQVVGLTATGCMRILVDFIVFMEELKKNIEPSPTLPPATEVQSQSPTSNLSECGSISPEKS